MCGDCVKLRGKSLGLLIAVLFMFVAGCSSTETDEYYSEMGCNCYDAAIHLNMLVPDDAYGVISGDGEIVVGVALFWWGGAGTERYFTPFTAATSVRVTLVETGIDYRLSDPSTELIGYKIQNQGVWVGEVNIPNGVESVTMLIRVYISDVVACFERVYDVERT